MAAQNNNPNTRSKSKKAPSQTALEKNVVAKKVVSSREDKFDWYSLYVYAICLVTILISIFGLVGFVRGLVDSLWPDPGYFDLYNIPTESKLTAEEIKKNLIAQNQRQAIKSMVNSMTTLVITIPIYLFHWKLAKKNRAGSTL
jgi:hypothetical protein